MISVWTTFLKDRLFYTSTYSLIYLLALGGIMNYNEVIGNIPEVPYLGVLFFGVPFVFLVIHGHFFESVRQTSFYKRNWRELLFGLLVTYMLACVTWHFLFEQITFQTSVHIGFIPVWYAIFFVVGWHFKNDKIHGSVIWGTYLLMLLNVVINLDWPLGRMHIGDSEQGIMHYLGDGFGILSLWLLSRYPNKWQSFLVIGVSIFCLYYVTSRASLYAFALTLILVLKRNRAPHFRFFFLGLLGLGMIYITLYWNELSQTRMLQFVLTGQDRSMNLRSAIFYTNISDLWENWFWGDYLGHLRHGVKGEYIHNYLSLWRQFGILPFLILLTLLYPFFSLFRKWWSTKTPTSTNDFLVYASFFVLIEIIFARSYRFYFIWLVIGMLTTEVKGTRLSTSTKSRYE